MSQLAKAIETKAEVIVAECIADTEFLLCSHSDLELVLCPSICNDLPVVLTIHEGSVRYHCSEQVISLKEECMAIITGEGNLFGWIVGVPAKLMNVGAKVQHLQTKALRLLVFLYLFNLHTIFASKSALWVTSLALVILPLIDYSKATSSSRLIVVLLNLTIIDIVLTCSIPARHSNARLVVILYLLRVLLAHLLLFFDFFTQHTFEGTQDFFFVVLAQHICKLSYFLALLRTAYKFFAHYAESDFI